MRYIDANEVKRQIERATQGQNDVMKVFLKTMHSIDNIPTADVVEVVRCKDCSHGEYSEDVLWCNITDEPMCEDDYCSRAERKEE